MKQIYIFIFLLLIAGQYSKGQNIMVQSGTSFHTTGNVCVTLQDMGINSISPTDLAGSNLYLKGNGNVTLATNGNFALQNLYVDKPSGTAFLGSGININTQISMIHGLLDLNGKNIILSPTALLNGETESSRITGLSGGEIMIAVNLNAPALVNPGNLGAIITSSSDLGNVIIKRGHKVQGGTGMSSSTNRYFDIQPANDLNLNATLHFKYFDAELNQQNENAMVMFRSTDNGATWTSQSITSHDAALNFVEKTQIPSFSRWTLSSAQAAPLPVLGLEFYAKRISHDKVQLDWKTIQEINNLGFHFERKKENENAYAETVFVPSLAAGGNSSFPLQYSRIDTNSFAGKTYYRLKQEDIDGHFIYSVIRVVNGENDKTMSLKAWPIPSFGDFNVLVQGIDKSDKIMIMDAAGKLIQQIQVEDNVRVTINKLPAGVYFLRLANHPDMVQRIIVQ